MTTKEGDDSRRAFLVRSASLAGAALSGPVAAVSTTAAAAVANTAPTAVPAAVPTALSEPAYPYFSLSPDEASFIETLVNVLCPADALTPNGVDCGLAVFIDRQLAGPYGKGDGRYQRGPFRTGKPEHGLQLPLSPAELCKLGMAAANAACVRANGVEFSGLSPAVADAFLTAVHDGRVKDDRISLALWFDEIIYPLFVEACFADPMYGGNRDAVFWRMIGYPGLPANHALDMVRYRGKPFPGARAPKSIADFT